MGIRVDDVHTSKTIKIMQKLNRPISPLTNSKFRNAFSTTNSPTDFPWDLLVIFKWKKSCCCKGVTHTKNPWEKINISPFFSYNFDDLINRAQRVGWSGFRGRMGRSFPIPRRVSAFLWWENARLQMWKYGRGQTGKRKEKKEGQ